MDGTQDDTKPLTRRLRHVVILAAVVLLAAGVVSAATGTVIDDFEDANTAEWTDGIVVDSGSPAEGTYWGNVTASGSDQFPERDLAGVGNASNFTFYVQFDSFGGSNFNNSIRLQQNTGADHAIEIDWDNTGTLSIEEDQTYEVTNFTMQTGTLYKVRMERIDHDNYTYDLLVYEDGTEVFKHNTAQFANPTAGTMDTIRLAMRDGTSMHIDYIRADGDAQLNTVTGTVTDRSGNPIENATVVATRNGSEAANVTTGSNGNYSYTVGDGDYNTSARKSGYITQSKNLTMNGSAVVQNFTLFNVSQVLKIDARRFMEHGQRIPYRVTFAANETASGTLQRRDVTNSSNLTMQSSDTAALTIDTNSFEFVSTANRSVNKIVTVTANYSYQGEYYVTDHNVTIANVTLENLEILPPWARFEATISPGTEANPNDHSFMLIMIATMVAVAGTLLMSVFVGLGGFTMIIMAGWLIGLTTTGLMLVVLTVVGFAGLNMAANIDYAVT